VFLFTESFVDSHVELNILCFVLAGLEVKVCCDSG